MRSLGTRGQGRPQAALASVVTGVRYTVQGFFSLLYSMLVQSPVDIKIIILSGTNELITFENGPVGDVQDNRVPFPHQSRNQEAEST